MQPIWPHFLNILHQKGSSTFPNLFESVINTRRFIHPHQCQNIGIINKLESNITFHSIINCHKLSIKIQISERQIWITNNNRQLSYIHKKYNNGTTGHRPMK